MQDNSSYTVTYPDLLITDDNFSMLIISTDEDFVAKVKKTFESVIRSSIVFYTHTTPTSHTNIAWPYYIFNSVDLVIVDLDTCQYVDTFFITEKEKDDNHWGIFVNQGKTKRELKMILNSQNKYTMLTNLDDELNGWISEELLGEPF